MRSLALALVLSAAVIVPCAASARSHPIAPPGNSGVNQYVESIPTADGNRPSTSVVPGTGGGGGESGGPSAPSPLAPTTQRALARQGAEGRRTALVARATAPSGLRGSARTHGGLSSARSAGGAGSGPSPASAVVKALTGSATSGGLGDMLPAILVLTSVGAVATAIVRRRRRAT